MCIYICCLCVKEQTQFSNIQSSRSVYVYVVSYNTARIFLRPPAPSRFIRSWAWASERELLP